MQQRTDYFPALTGLRALAAYMVFVFHFNPFKVFQNEPETIANKLFHFCNELHVGVTVFFVLSGFLITLRYKTTVRLTKPWLFHYALNRFSRLFPIYTLILAFTLAVIFLRIDYSSIREHIYFPPINKTVTILLNLTLLKGFSSSLNFSGIVQAWSLTVEECFYFTAPFVLASTFSLARKMTLYVTASFIIGLLLTGIGWHAAYYGFFSNFNFLFNYTFFGRCFEFASGVTTAYLLTTSYRFSYQHFTIISIVIIVLSTVLLTFYHKTTWQGITVNNFLLPLGICILLAGLVYEKTYLSRLLETKLFELLGKSSYAFYLIHLGVIQLLISHYISQNILVCFLLLNGLAILLFKFVEEPCHKALKKVGSMILPASTLSM